MIEGGAIAAKLNIPEELHMGIVLKVDDRAIAEADLYPLLAKYQLLPQLAREILVEEAIAGFQCTPEEIELARQQFYQRNQIAEAQLQSWLDFHGMTREQMEYQVIKDTKVEKFKLATWGDRLEVHFAECKRQLDRVVYSLLRHRDAGIIQELYFRIQEEESSFAELARQYSQGTEAQTSGLIGPVELSVPHPQISTILARSRPGQISPPKQVGEWWVILRLEQFMSAQLDVPTRQRLLNDLFQKWLLEQMQQRIKVQSDSESESDSDSDSDSESKLSPVSG
jgi:parvulin-like peptidyl-prolyl isomerase